MSGENVILLEKIINIGGKKIACWDSSGRCIFASASYLKFIGREDGSTEGLMPQMELASCLGQTGVKYNATLERFDSKFSASCIADGNGGCIIEVADCSEAAECQPRAFFEPAAESGNPPGLDLKNILHCISEIFCVISSNWQLLYWNPAAELATGRSEAEVLGKHIWDIFPQEQDSALYGGCTEAMERRVSLAFEHNSRNGSWFYNSVHPNEEGGITIYFKDITDRKKAEHEVVALKNNLNGLINASDDLMWSVGIDLMPILSNAAHARFTACDGLLGNGVISLLGGGGAISGPKLNRLYRKALAGRSFQAEVQSMPNHVIKFNPIRDTSGCVTGVACHAVDVSAIRLLEKEKRVYGERFQALVQSGSDLMFILDASYSLNYVSPSAVALFGFEGRMESFRMREFLHPDDMSAIRAAVYAGPFQTLKLKPFRVRSHSGQWVWIEAVIDNLLDNTHVAGMVVNARDVTERKASELEREILIKELTRSNSYLMQFSFIISHNLRAPLSNIIGLLQLLEEHRLDPDAGRICSLIEESASKLNDTIRDLSDILLIRNSKKVPTGLVDMEAAFVQANSQFLNVQDEIGADVRMVFKEKHAFFNEQYLQSIYTNLVSNAIKYRDETRKLIITVTVQAIADNKTELLFEDNGIGIDTLRHGKRLFGMYQRFHSESEGQGLGLFIIKTQIESLGGSIDISSEVGKGTQFAIQLPNLSVR